MDELKQFLKAQEIFQIAPAAGEPWISNVYLMYNKGPEKMYFIGSKSSLYGEQLLQDPKLAFATAWHKEGDHIDRKGVQGIASAHVADTDEDILIAVSMHNKRYPEFADQITVEHMLNNITGACVWIVEPTFIKFWNDELYGEDGCEEFKF